MQMEIFDFRITCLIDRYRRGTITEPERRELDLWIARNPDNAAIFKHVCEASAREKYAEFSAIDRTAAWEGLTRQIRQHHGRTRARRIAWTVAAAAVLALGLFTGIQRQWFFSEPVLEIENIGPGGKNAILTLADGTNIALDKVESNLVHQEQALVKVENGEVSYQDVDSSAVNVYNSITIPRGGEHRLTLSDGTRIWLNSDSHIRYPMMFSSTERRVYLSGEAYFDVEADLSRPFIVETETQSLEVLGTEFNVTEYQNELHTLTTLVEGSVRITGKTSGDEVTLRPGEQSRLMHDDNTLTVAAVDVTEFTSWRDGLINIQNNTLEQVLAKLSRWYDVDFEMADQGIGEIVFEGDIPKGSNLGSVLKLLETAGGIEFRPKTDIIEVTKK